MKDMNILIVGVGGQGTLLASVLLGKLALEEGYDVKLAEVHGMAQRGGSVVTHVRISEEQVSSPLIEEGGADVIVAFEELEGYHGRGGVSGGDRRFLREKRQQGNASGRSGNRGGMRKRQSGEHRAFGRHGKRTSIF